MTPPQPLTLLPHETALLERETFTLIRPVEPQPPAKYTEPFIEPGWLWSRSTSGEGNEQQDLWLIPWEGAWRSDTRYYVQEEYSELAADWAEPAMGKYVQIGIIYEDEEVRFVRHLRGTPRIEADYARHHLTCESVDVKQMKDLTAGTLCAAGIVPLKWTRFANGTLSPTGYAPGPVSKYWNPLFPSRPYHPDLWVVVTRFRKEGV